MKNQPPNEWKYGELSEGTASDRLEDNRKYPQESPGLMMSCLMKKETEGQIENLPKSCVKEKAHGEREGT